MPPSKSNPTVPDANVAPIDLSQQLLEADAIIRRMSSDYIGVLEADILRMRECLNAARRSADVAAELPILHDIAHDIKGQGGTFGYPLISQIGEALCRYLAETMPLKFTDLRVVEMHLDALTAVARHRIVGHGGQSGADIVRNLDLLRLTIIAKPSAKG